MISRVKRYFLEIKSFSDLINLNLPNNYQIVLDDKKDFQLNKAVTHVANLMGSKEKGYRALTNIGSDGGQEVPHLHFHIFAGEKIGKMVT